jgi:hypothetical protein
VDPGSVARRIVALTESRLLNSFPQSSSYLLRNVKVKAQIEKPLRKEIVE